MSRRIFFQSFSLLSYPLDAAARGNIDIEAIFYLGIGALAIIFCYQFWSRILIYISVLVVSAFQSLSGITRVKIRDHILSFATSGFLLTFPIFYGLVLTSHIGMQWYYVVSLGVLIDLIVWYVAAIVIQKKEDCLNKPSKQ